VDRLRFDSCDLDGRMSRRAFGIVW